MKTDARIRYTKNVIKETFLSLLKDKTVDKITVTELCNRAEINRATFYRYYFDCYDLLSKIEDEFLEKFQSTGKTENWCESKELISAIYDTIAENMEICDVLIFGVKNSSLLNKMIEAAKNHCMNRWRENLRNLSENEIEMLFIYLSTGLSAVIYKNFKICERDELINFMVDITTNCISHFVNQ